MTSSPEAIIRWIPPIFGTRGRPPAGARDGVWRPAELPSSKMPPPKSESDEAYAQGYQEGVREGSTRAVQGLEPVAQVLRGVAEKLDEDRTRFARERARDLQALALGVARKLVQRAVAEDATVVAELVQRALDLMPPDAPIEIRVSLADLEALSEHIERITPAGSAVLLRWVADPSLERGSFVLDSPSRVVDGRIDVALSTLYERLDA